MGRKRKKRKKRGYPVAILIGFEEKHQTRAVFWNIFSEMIKLHHPHVLKMGKKRKYASEKQIYQFQEEIIDILRPSFKEGVKSIILVAEAKSNYCEEFLEHIKKHQHWMLRKGRHNSIAFGKIYGKAGTTEEITALIELKEYNEIMEKTTTNEADEIIKILERRINDVGGESLILYSLKEIEKYVYRWNSTKLKPEYLILTEKHLNKSKKKSRIHRLLQICQNMKIKTKIIGSETMAGLRIEQLGGMVCFTESKSQYKKRMQIE